MANPILSIQQISKRFGKVQALNQVSFDIPTGSVFCILGPNGSGKTTLLGIILTLIKANQGQILYAGQPIRSKDLQRIGGFLETPNFYAHLTAQQNLEITAKVKKLTTPNYEQLLKQVGLYDSRNRIFQSFSLGMKQRLAIAQTLLGNPDLIILDEPTNGLDPTGITEVREIIRHLHQQGHTILLASHMLNEVQSVCTHVAILQKGHLIAQNSLAEILSPLAEIEVACDDMPQLRAVMERYPNVSQITQAKDEVLHIQFSSQPRSLAEVNAFCFRHGITLSHLKQKTGNLESTFIQLTSPTP